MRVLIGCEFSGVVRCAFRALGHDAWSCDMLPAEDGSPYHLQGDVLAVLDRDWDIGIFHPPCTHLTRAGDRWYRNSPERAAAVAFVQQLWDAPIPRIAIENPRGLDRHWRRASQAVQPWWFGAGETKATLLWLKNLPPLIATDVVEGREPRVHLMAPGPNRWKERSRTTPGLGAAMAQQWGGVAFGVAA